MVTGASINNPSERGWGSTVVWHKQTILSMFYVPTCRPSFSGVASVGLFFHVATHWVLSCCVAVVVRAWLTASFRVVFLANEVPMGVAVTAAVFLFPTCTFVVAAHAFIAVYCFYEDFDLIWLLSSLTVLVRFWSALRSEAVAVAKFARASAVSCKGWPMGFGGWKPACCAVRC